jgi:hypothetical protein
LTSCKGRSAKKKKKKKKRRENGEVTSLETESVTRQTINYKKPFELLLLAVFYLSIKTDRRCPTFQQAVNNDGDERALKSKRRGHI